MNYDKYNKKEKSSDKDRLDPMSDNQFWSEESEMDKSSEKEIYNMSNRDMKVSMAADSKSGKDEPTRSSSEKSNISGSKQDFNRSSHNDIAMGADSRSKNEPSDASAGEAARSDSKMNEKTQSDMQNEDKHSSKESKMREQGPYGMNEAGHGSESSEKEER